MGFKFKLVLMASVFLLGGTGAAFAASGHVPDVLQHGSAGTGTAIGSQYGNTADNGNGAADAMNNPGDNAVEGQYGHGNMVSGVAHDRSATGTMELPNGNMIENHGQAVRDAAHRHESDTHTQNAPVMTPGQNTAPSGGQATENTGSHGMGSAGSVTSTGTTTGSTTGMTTTGTGSSGMRGSTGMRGGR
ncbi:MAG: hypothetical protein ACYCXF_02760 [Thermoleophilia bacterium]